MTLRKVDRDVELTASAAQYLFRLGRDRQSKVLEPLYRLAMDPYLRDLQEEEDESFLLTSDHVIFVECTDTRVLVLEFRKRFAS